MIKQNEILEAPVMDTMGGASSRNRYSGEELMSILEPQIRAMFR